MSRKTLLLCDDDSSILEALELALASHFNIIAESDSVKVIDLIRTHEPDVLVVDLWMPYLSGEQLIRLVRGDKRTAKLPILAISASTTGQIDSLTAGADRFLAKPFDLDQLLSELHLLSDPAYEKAK